jgi:hypothetical protein
MVPPEHIVCGAPPSAASCARAGPDLVSILRTSGLGNMQRLNRAVLALCIGLSFCGVARADCDEVPPPVQEALKAEPEWVLVQRKDLLEEHRVFSDEARPGLCPGFAAADLEGEGRPSYALSLIKFEGTKTFQKLVVLRPDGDGFKPETLVDAREIAMPFVVFNVGPGTYDRAAGDKGVTVKTDSIVYARLFTGATQYYLAKGKFRSFAVTDRAGIGA